MREPFHCAPSFEAGCRMPTSKSIEHGDHERRLAAQYGSRELLAAIHSYFLNGGTG